MALNLWSKKKTGRLFMMNYLIKISLVAVLVLMTEASFGQNRKKQKVIDVVLTEANTYIGTPYRYGGMSRKGIDCSGLVYSCYKKAGIELPRTAKDQSKIGSSKGWDSIRPGDIVFFKFKQKGDKWFHSGMITYAESDDIRFIHASSSRGVVESSLLADYYKKNVTKFRRVIK